MAFNDKVWDIPTKSWVNAPTTYTAPAKGRNRAAVDILRFELEQHAGLRPHVMLPLQESPITQDVAKDTCHAMIGVYEVGEVLELSDLQLSYDETLVAIHILVRKENCPAYANCDPQYPHIAWCQDLKSIVGLWLNQNQQGIKKRIDTTEYPPCITYPDCGITHIFPYVFRGKVWHVESLPQTDATAIGYYSLKGHIKRTV